MRERKLGTTAAIAGALVAAGLVTATPARAETSLSDLKKQYGPDLEALGRSEERRVGKECSS